MSLLTWAQGWLDTMARAERVIPRTFEQLQDEALRIGQDHPGLGRPDHAPVMPITKAEMDVLEDQFNLLTYRVLDDECTGQRELAPMLMGVMLHVTDR